MKFQRLSRPEPASRLLPAFCSRLLAVLLQLSGLGLARAEDHVDYKFEDYDEDHGRMRIFTQSALFEAALGKSVVASGQLVYDSISGATPTGGRPPAGGNQVPLTELRDIRRAANLATAIQWGGNQTTTPEAAYSLERDYQSIGVSLTHSIEFNQKNTTLTLGASHDFDSLFEPFWSARNHKSTTEFLLGLSQLLSPKTLLSAALTLGTEAGYLSDPYRGFNFDDYPDPNALFPENRPRHKTREVFLLSLNQHVDPLNGSAEVSYRFYHDTFGIFAHTASLEWFQKIGKHVIVSPLFRYYRQTAARFYATHLPGDPTIPPGSPFFSGVYLPEFYSSDYRLSELSTVTFGIGATFIINSHVYLDAAYKRYAMYGEDGVTSPSAYPKANIFTVGARAFF